MASSPTSSHSITATLEAAKGAINEAFFPAREAVRDALAPVSKDMLQTEVSKLKVPTDFVITEGDSFSIKPYDSAAGIEPLICFVNPKSGGCLGSEIYTKLQEILTPFQVFDLTKGGPAPGLRKFRNPENNSFYPCKILACGGDGTVGWVLSVLDAIETEQKNNAAAPATADPPVAVLPLGTGNDMARTLGTGAGWDNSEGLAHFLYSITTAKKSLLDRWKLTITPTTTTTTTTPPDSSSEVKSFIMNNYFSFGVDAKVALQFHQDRNAAPEKFKSRWGNKFHYGLLSATSMLTGQQPNIPDVSTIWVDNNNELEIEKSQAFMVTNLPNYAAGVNIWGSYPEKYGFSPQHLSDQLLEVCTVDNLAHLGSILPSAGLAHANRIAQANSLMIKINATVAMQVDGEPWEQPGPCEVKIVQHRQSPVLVVEQKSLLNVG
eukprot:TRINITY_DN66140_c3_g1_i2.p1 TRINITY_DN66140_c3_g1~~TRINITY_DN66140_c3_g1_i2.p1  ORF type:complete len:435 (+),score=51.37 TRINITY_DN66140_c3_g1_i2:44-1348(+)